ncbi:MAG: PD-(D/E)XK nuclease family transposase [Bacteroidales bacterium]|nr:Rpn family recombination-promoting nuclease/putative transposase [Bacteroidales bacterium]MDD5815137.1 PD-(D/E)XK nuclease family transposase [Bacteroidales bacterium]MDY4519780.1 PD-(D/E)XK nuclease family transposase [Bacteroidales bacterium]
MDPQYVRFDWAMKRMLRDKANHAVLEGLITVLLGQKYTISSILESEGNQQTEDDKFNRVDLMAESEDGELIIVEIQNTRELYYFHRILYGTSKAITEYIKRGEKYDKVRKVFSINIVYFDMGQGEDYVYHGRTTFRGLHNPNDILKLTKNQTESIFGKQRVEDVGMEDAGAIFPEYYILRVNDFNSVAKTPIEEWMFFLKNGEIRQDTKTPGLIEARETLKYDMLSPDDKKTYLRMLDNNAYAESVIDTSFREGERQGEEKGREKGMKEGLQKGKEIGREEGIEEGLRQAREEHLKQLKHIVISLIDNGLNNEAIAKALSITVEEVQKLRT